MNVLVLTLLLLPGIAMAQAGQIHGGVSYLHSMVSYKEPGVMSEKGTLKGVGLDLRYNLTDELAVFGQAKFLNGHLEYDGATFSGIPLSQTTDDTIREYRALVSYKLGNLMPYVGYGTRYWRNDLVISYVRETTYHYMPLGLQYGLWPFYVSYELRHFLNGVNKSHMSDVDPNRSDVTLDQESGEGYALEVGYIGDVFSLQYKLSVAYEYWRIDDSEIANDGVDTLVEPHNSTNTVTVSVGLYY